MSKIKGWRRYADKDMVREGKNPGTTCLPDLNRYTVPCQVTVLDPEVVDLDCPPPGTEVMWNGRRVTIESGPKMDRYCDEVVVVIRSRVGELLLARLRAIHPRLRAIHPRLRAIHPLPSKRYRAVYEAEPGEGEEEVRARYGIDEDVTLEEVEDE